MNIEQSGILYDKVAKLIEQARQKVTTTVNLTMVHTYYEIGRYIVEDEQQGERRAEYGKALLKELSKQLTERFGKGFSVDGLERMKNFYLIYSAQKSETVLRISEAFSLSWSHYLVLMRVDNPDARRFYEIEATQQQWSVRQLARQCSSSLYERLALSRDKDEIMRLANEGQTLEKPADILKSPFTLEFLGLDERSAYTESELEGRIISNLQKFLLEMGKGFLFEARQKRFTFDEDSYYVDLVLYNRLLQSYVLIDLKTNKLSHQDLGQMQMYVNYYDRYVKQPFENPTIGILLCETANQTVVELTLPKDSNIHAAEYALYLPDKKLLQQKLQEWRNEYEGVTAIKNKMHDS
ncbi:MAG: PDDEXK nuclease domain-containing protein [Prevotellaceae bacterium]|jgi:predicted nuclease of restriction endonuclease-like (RecB) superfamily|nr:PDDEXK nuclease domain-containing protein [Prevotellaceae bacterium]